MKEVIELREIVQEMTDITEDDFWCAYIKGDDLIIEVNEFEDE